MKVAVRRRNSGAANTRMMTMALALRHCPTAAAAGTAEAMRVAHGRPPFRALDDASNAAYRAA
jgi:hypothetical protein